MDGEPVLFEICDTCPKVIKILNMKTTHNLRKHLQTASEMPLKETVLWADGFVLVYSITDRTSFNYVKAAKAFIAEVRRSPNDQQPPSMALLGNKGDMVHLRQVAAEEGEILAKDFDCFFGEVAAADQVVEVAEAFHDLCREIAAVRRKNKTSLLDRVLGNKTASGLRVYSRGKSDSVLSKD